MKYLLYYIWCFLHFRKHDNEKLEQFKSDYRNVMDRYHRSNLGLCHVFRNEWSYSSKRYKGCLGYRVLGLFTLLYKPSDRTENQYWFYDEKDRYRVLLEYRDRIIKTKTYLDWY